MKRIILAALLALATAPAYSQQEVYRPLTSYQFNISSSVATSSRAVMDNVRLARVLCTVTCQVAFMVTPIVAAASVYMVLPANTVQYYRVSPGTRAYVISTTNGIVYVTEVE